MRSQKGRGTPLEHARLLRRRATEAEQRLWRNLRNRRLNGYKFRRQTVIGPYVVDFYCHEARLAIEADGGQHAQGAAYDARRTAFLKGRGIRVLRYWNNEILNELPSVLQQIAKALEEGHPSPRPSP